MYLQTPQFAIFFLPEKQHRFSLDPSKFSIMKAANKRLDCRSIITQDNPFFNYLSSPHTPNTQDVQATPYETIQTLLTLVRAADKLDHNEKESFMHALSGGQRKANLRDVIENHTTVFRALETLLKSITCFKKAPNSGHIMYKRDIKITCIR